MVAFGKSTNEAKELVDMFVSGKLSWEATPSNVVDQFVTIKNNYSMDKIRAGFNRCKGIAKKEVLNKLRNVGGKCHG